jgi:hypothetical protein
MGARGSGAGQRRHTTEHTAVAPPVQRLVRRATRHSLGIGCELRVSFSARLESSRARASPPHRPREAQRTPTCLGVHRWGQPLSSDRSHKSFRPLVVLGFRVDYALGGLHPLGYHAVNIALHAVASVQVATLTPHTLYPVPSTGRGRTGVHAPTQCGYGTPHCQIWPPPPQGGSRNHWDLRSTLTPLSSSQVVYVSALLLRVAPRAAASAHVTTTCTLAGTPLPLVLGFRLPAAEESSRVWSHVTTTCTLAGTPLPLVLGFRLPAAEESSRAWSPHRPRERTGSPNLQTLRSPIWLLFSLALFSC